MFIKILRFHLSLGASVQKRIIRYAFGRMKFKVSSTQFRTILLCIIMQNMFTWTPVKKSRRIMITLQRYSGIKKWYQVSRRLPSVFWRIYRQNFWRWPIRQTLKEIRFPVGFCSNSWNNTWNSCLRIFLKFHQDSIEWFLE